MVYFARSALEAAYALLERLGLLLLVADVEHPGAGLGEVVLARDDLEVGLRDLLPLIALSSASLLTDSGSSL